MSPPAHAHPSFAHRFQPKTIRAPSSPSPLSTCSPCSAPAPWPSGWVFPTHWVHASCSTRIHKHTCQGCAVTVSGATACCVRIGGMRGLCPPPKVLPLPDSCLHHFCARRWRCASCCWCPRAQQQLPRSWDGGCSCSSQVVCVLDLGAGWFLQPGVAITRALASVAAAAVAGTCPTGGGLDDRRLIVWRATIAGAASMRQLR
eukprot:scaffold184900_cov19-Tisochrysis_lutea.AAC.1